MSDDPITSDDDLRDLRVGALVTLKGRLESVRYGIRGHGQWATNPSLVVVFGDWSMLSVSVKTEDLARSIRIPLQSYVTVRACVHDEDMELAGIAVWTQGGVPVPLGYGPLSVEETGQVT